MKIFVSYARENGGEAAEIVESLRSAGHAVFFDKDDLPPGIEFNDRIRQAMHGSSLMIFLASKASLAEGASARSELELARTGWPNPRGWVLPVVLAEVSIDDLPPYLRSLTCLQAQGSLVAETVHAVGRIAAARRRRRAGWLGAVVLGAAAVTGVVLCSGATRGARDATRGSPDSRPVVEQPSFDRVRWLCEQGIPAWLVAKDAITVAKIGLFEGVAFDQANPGAAIQQLVARLRTEKPQAWAFIRGLGVRKLGPFLVCVTGDDEFFLAAFVNRTTYDDGTAAFSDAGITADETGEVYGCRVRMFQTGQRKMAFAIATTIPPGTPVESIPALEPLQQYPQVLMIGCADLVTRTLAQRTAPPASLPAALADIDQIAGLRGNWASWTQARPAGPESAESAPTSDVLGVAMPSPIKVLVGTGPFSIVTFDAMTNKNSAVVEDLSARVILGYRSSDRSSAAADGLRMLHQKVRAQLDLSEDGPAATFITDNMGVEVLAIAQIIVEAVTIAPVGSNAVVAIDAAKVDMSVVEARAAAMVGLQNRRIADLQSRVLSPASTDLVQRVRDHVVRNANGLETGVVKEMGSVSNPSEVLVPLVIECRADWSAVTRAVMLIAASRDHPDQLDDWIRNGAGPVLSMPTAFPDSTGFVAIVVQAVSGGIALGLSSPGNLRTLALRYSRSVFPPAFEIVLAHSLCLEHPKTLKTWESLLELLGDASLRLRKFREVSGRAIGKCAVFDTGNGLSLVVAAWSDLPQDVRTTATTQMEAELAGMSDRDQKDFRLAILRLGPGKAKEDMLEMLRNR